ncbi:MAG: hypothetical protein ACRC5M_03310 [Anaeroplasmataceae bacterium]
MAEMEKVTNEDTINITIDETKENKGLKEYQKLLKLEEGRKQFNKAKKMVKLGLFKQDRDDNFDISKVKKVYTTLKYKGAYILYKSKSGNDFYFIKELSESDTKRAFAYDIIEIETVTDEEYILICEASKYEKNRLLSFSFPFVGIMFIATLIVAVVYLVIMVIDGIEIQSLISFFLTFLPSVGSLAALTVISFIMNKKFNE